ncbi:MAG: hypothetical protein M3247_07185 [Thermoproteota archaeon]|nr:hypothetical protein [Thermoproteota archaeon]
MTVSPDFKGISYKASITPGSSSGTRLPIMISGTVSGTLTFDPAIDFEHAKDQTAKTNKMTFELSIAKVKLEFDRGGASTGEIDFS